MIFVMPPGRGIPAADRLDCYFAAPLPDFAVPKRAALLATEIGALIPYASVLGGIEHKAVDVLVSAVDNVDSVDERYLGISYSLF